MGERLKSGERSNTGAEAINILWLIFNSRFLNVVIEGLEEDFRQILEFFGKDFSEPKKTIGNSWVQSFTYAEIM
jgi:hypothetical protein